MGHCSKELRDLPQSIDTAGVSAKLVHNIQFIDPCSVSIDATDLRVSSGVSQLPLQQAVVDCVLHDCV